MVQTSSDTASVRPHDLQVLAENLYRKRTWRVPKMSQEALAQASGVTVNVITTIEGYRDPAKLEAALGSPRGPAWPTLRTLTRLAEPLDCAVDDLLRYEPSRVKLHGVPSRPPVRGMQPRPVQSPLVFSVPDGG